MHSDIDRFTRLTRSDVDRFFLHFMHDYKRVGSLFDPATCRVQRLLRARVLPRRHGHRRARAAWHHSGRHR